MGIPLGEYPSPADIDRFLTEDVGAGDLTAESLPKDLTATATVITREPMVLCGRAWFEGVFERLGSDVVIEWLHGEGDWIEPTISCVALKDPPAP